MVKPDRKIPLALGLAACLLVIILAGLVAVQPARAQATTEYCLTCHGNPDANMTLPGGESLSIHISPQMLEQSVHATVGLECSACHAEITTYPHPEISYNTKRELARAFYETCRKCHTENYDRTMDSMHAQAAAEGNLDAPICTDCHGAHDVRIPDEPRALISETCGQCHTEILAAYRESIHGGALINEDNQDVPVCTDCHGVHNIQDPRTQQFRVAEPDLCAGCHADPELMGKYDLPANVYDLYELSWHGVDVSVYKSRWPTIWHNSAICSDCHGVHDIRKTDDPASRVNPANLLVTCQECHPGAGPNWTGAWTGHNEVSVERTPFVYYTQAFYTSFSPFILWVSVIYVALQIIRSTVDRMRRSLTR